MYSQVESQIQFFSLCVSFVHLSLFPFFYLFRSLFLSLLSLFRFFFLFVFFIISLFLIRFCFSAFCLPLFLCFFYLPFLPVVLLPSRRYYTMPRITNHTLCPPSGLVPEQTCQVEKAGPVAALAGCLEDEMSGTGCSAVAAR